LFGLIAGYAFSGYAVYGWRKARGQHTSVVSTSTQDPDEKDLHR